VGRIVRRCEERGEGLSALTETQAREFHPLLEGDLSARLDPRAAAERRSSRGGTAWSEVRRQVDLLRNMD
jgi:argininosuccinate lyase